MVLDDTDKKILNRIQSDFPATRTPYAEIARQLDLSEAEVIRRVRILKREDIIRRIGGNFSPKNLGFVSTLCAAAVPEERLDAFKDKINGFSGVTHNYLRKNRYNVWFTFIAPSMEEIESNIREIEEDTGVSGILNLPATDVFKIRAEFDV